MASFRKSLFKLYLNFPLTRFFVMAVRNVWVPPYRLRKYMRFRGPFRLYYEKNSFIRMVSYGNTIENELFWCGITGWEQASLKLWKELCRNANTILDVGANTGLYSLVAGKVNPAAKIYAFEPLDNIFDRLQRNLKLNKIAANTHRVALATENGESYIYAAETVSDTFDQASLSNSRYANKKMRKIPIQVRRLDAVIQAEGIASVDLMKIDVETFEPAVLEGMGNFLHQFRPDILVEILNAQVGDQVEKLIDSSQYEFFRIDEATGPIRTNSLKPEKRGGNYYLRSLHKSQK